MSAALAPPIEPILTLPVGLAALGLLLIFAVIIVVTLLVARRRQGTIRDIPGIGDALWLAALLDSLPQAAVVADSDGRPIAWNAAAAHLLSLDEEARGLPLSLAALVARVLDSKVAETIEVTVAGRRERATASPLRATGHSYGALVLIQDSTQGGTGTESYRRLVSAVSHELRTPLTAIKGHVQILQSCEFERDVALWHRSLGFIAREAERLTRLVEDLLTLSRLDLTPLQRQPTNLRAVAEEAISTLYQAAEDRGVQLSLRSPPDLPRVLGDRDRLYQVFLNLVDNAVKYSHTRGEASVGLSPDERSVQVEVRDDGIGIASEDLPYIFRPLYRSKDARDIPGTGLGLTIVRTILEQHGSAVAVQSAPGHGTIFRFRLPRAPSSQPRVSFGSSQQ